MRTADVHDMVAELCRPRAHAERYDVKVKGTVWNRRHHSIVPSLLAQLEHAQPSGKGGERPAGFESRPAASIEALDTMTLIDLEASRWLRLDFHLDDPGSTAACVTKLGSLYPSLDAEVQKELRRDINRWWTRARVVTGWDVAPVALYNTCPVCSKRGSLRIRIFTAADVSAFCADCGCTWDASTIGLLAEHIHMENGENEVETDEELQVLAELAEVTA